MAVLHRFYYILLLAELVKCFLVCKIDHELVGGLEPNLHGYNIWAELRLD